MLETLHRLSTVATVAPASYRDRAGILAPTHLPSLLLLGSCLLRGSVVTGIGRLAPACAEVSPHARRDLACRSLPPLRAGDVGKGPITVDAYLHGPFPRGRHPRVFRTGFGLGGAPQ